MALFGLVAVLEGHRLGVGTLSDMGPGFVPMALGVILSGVGLIIALVGQTDPEDDAAGPVAPDWRGAALHPGGRGAVHRVGPAPRPRCRDLRQRVHRRTRRPHDQARRRAAAGRRRHAVRLPAVRHRPEDSDPTLRIALMLPAFADLGHGFAVALEPHNLMWCLFGVLVGQFVGVLPGMGAMAAISLLLPLTFAMQAGGRDPDAGRHLLRLAVWRRDLLDPAQPALPPAARRDLPRRLSADAAGQGRHGAGHRHASLRSSGPRSASPK